MQNELSKTQKAFPYTLGTSVAHRAKMGLIVLQVDETLEYELRQLLPDEGVGLYASRVPSAPTVTTSTLAQMEKTLPAAAALLPSIDLQIVGYGCTSGTAVIGAPRIAELIKSSCNAAAITEPVTALIAACHQLKISRLSLLSPYIEEVSETLRQVLADAGIQTPHFGSFDESTESNVARIDARSITLAAIDLYRRGEVDAVFISCTSLQTLDIIASIEETCGCPVLSSNLVLGWHMLQQANLKAKNPAMGRLLQTL